MWCYKINIEVQKYYAPHQCAFFLAKPVFYSNINFKIGFNTVELFSALYSIEEKITWYLDVKTDFGVGEFQFIWTQGKDEKHSISNSK